MQPNKPYIYSYFYDSEIHSDATATEKPLLKSTNLVTNDSVG
jgi:hypothetical protein